MEETMDNSSLICNFAHMNIKELQGKRIAVLLSGGVDSSVVLHQLAQQGLHPDCFYINNYSSYGLWDSRKNLMYMQMVVAGVFEDDSNTNKLSKNQVGLMFYTKKK